MSTQVGLTQDEKTLAGLAHGSVLLGVFTSGIGGILAALVIWLVQREKSAYVAFQALQALIYQTVTFIVTMLAWCCWGALWTTMLLAPLMSNPDAYGAAPTAGFWLGLLLMVLPMGLWGFTILYGLWGAVRCLAGDDFRYVVIGKWLGTGA